MDFPLTIDTKTKGISAYISLEPNLGSLPAGYAFSLNIVPGQYKKTHSQGGTIRSRRYARLCDAVAGLYLDIFRVVYGYPYRNDDN